ncbi:MAG: hypothetical protein MI975_25825, partial [Cytophagales bacterium]|nr:hypothetical protein [Cytophagales bacterium]
WSDQYREPGYDGSGAPTFDTWQKMQILERADWSMLGLDWKNGQLGYYKKESAPVDYSSCETNIYCQGEFIYADITMGTITNNWVFVSLDDKINLEGDGLAQTSGGNGLSISNENSTDFNWLNLTAAEVTIWGGATTIAVRGPKPTYTGPGDWAKQVKAGTRFGRALGGIGLGLTLIDMGTNGINMSNSLDATFGVVGFFGPIGAGIAGVYFIGNTLTYGITGQTIGEHIDNYYWVPNPGGIGFIPVGKKPGR